MPTSSFHPALLVIGLAFAANVAVISKYIHDARAPLAVPVPPPLPPPVPPPTPPGPTGPSTGKTTVVVVTTQRGTAPGTGKTI